MLKPVGAIYQGQNQCQFRVWAPFRKNVKLEIEEEEGAAFEMQKDECGYWKLTMENVALGTKYRFLLDDELARPDPASRDQAEGVHGWSKTRKTDFDWSDLEWQPVPLEQMIIYELHTGTFTREGTFEAITHKLDYLLELGINAIELMPVCPFPGTRNWGYDGVYPYAVQDSYGGAAGLKKLVNACHKKDIAVVLDVVYNHLGPEGNYLNDFGPYFTEKYHTPWGGAINFDDAYSDSVRSFFLHAAMMWLEEFHIDALRLDAVHAIFDNSTKHILQEMREEADKLQQQTRRTHYLIAESDLNDVRLLKSYHEGGYNLDGQWADDFHHSVHTLATGENKGYYSDFGKVEDLAKTFQQAFVYDGTAYSQFRKRTLGSDPSVFSSGRFVVCIQNHDQVGNRMLGERLSHLVSYEMAKLCAGVLIISPYLPLLFMGEEYGEKHPFQYFVSHSDPQLVEAVRKGRSQEFESFQWKGEVPDPQAVETFERSKLQWNFAGDEKQEKLLQYYRHLIARRRRGDFKTFSDGNIETKVNEKDKTLAIHSSGNEQLLAVLNFDEEPHTIELVKTKGIWEKTFASCDELWLGPGGAAASAKPASRIEIPPTSLIVFQNENQNE